jgi:tetratricopeptide (TPR) repeat protein
VPAHTPRHITPPEQVARRRSRNIEGHLDRARRAFEAGDFVAAIAAAEDAELLDPRDPRVIDVLTSARDRLDQQQIGTWLAEAEQCIARRDLEGADALVSKALGLDATSSAARHIRSVIGRARREIEHQAEAVAAVETARRRFAGGDAAAAISLLDAFSPPHPLVTQARDDLASELLRQEQLKRAREAQRRAEALDGALSAAAAHLARQAWDEASSALVDAEALSPHDARLPPLRDALASGREAAWARTKIVTRAVSAAGQLLTAADLDGAERLVDEALAVDPGHPDALALRARIAERREVLRARDEPDGDRSASGVGHRAAEDEHAVKTTVRTRHGAGGERRADESARDAAAPDPAGDETSGAYAPALAASRRRKVGAALGVSVAIVVPALLLGLWWRTDSLADRPIPADIARNESPTVAEPIEIQALPPVIPAADPRPDPATAPAAAPPVSAQPADSTERGKPDARIPIERVVENRPAVAAGADSIPPPDPQPRGTPQLPPEMAPALPPSIPQAAPPAVEVRDVVSPALTGVSAGPAPVVPAPAPAPPPEVVPRFDPGIAQRILDEYVDVMRRLDFGALQRMYPSAPTQVRLRIEALRKDYSHCDVRFSNVETAPVNPSSEVTVRASGTESCKPKTRQPSFDRTTRFQFRLVKDASDRWIVSELLTQ